jgi:multiple sugar transport system substrate-binding protein
MRKTGMGRPGARARWLAAVGAALALSACSGGGHVGGGPTTIEFATQGLGKEVDATNKEVAAFEREHPSIRVNILTLSPQADVAYQQLSRRFASGDSMPDVVTLDVIWPAAFARSGWLAPLDGLQPNRADYFQGQVDAGTYQGRLYAVPWFINAEGVYYRKDLVPAAPTSPQQLVQLAQAAMQKDPSIRDGLAFEGDRYEGVVTAFINFGGVLDLHHVDSARNVRALSFMRDAIATSHISSPATTTWQEPNVEQSYLAGHAAFAMNWPYVFSLAEAPSSPVSHRTGWIPFPSVEGPVQAALGGYVLGINARSPQKDVAWQLIRHLLRVDVQIQRALTAGDPPGVRSAYNATLFDQAPFYRDEQAVFNVGPTPRPVDPQYPRISEVLQNQLNGALQGQVTPETALAAAQAQINGILAHG